MPGIPFWRQYGSALGAIAVSAHPESGHVQCNLGCPLCTNSGRTQELAVKHDRPCAPVAVHRMIAAGFLFATITLSVGAIEAGSVIHH